MSDQPQSPLVTEIDRHTQDMQATIAAVEAWVGVLDAYITRTFRAGIDYGSVKGEVNGKEFEGKPTLLKPGAEKLTLVLGLRATFVADTETYDQAGRPAGLIALKCLLLDQAGAIVGEGRGAAALAEKKTINLAVKFAEKRAHIDAILRHTGLSGRFVGEEVRGAARSKTRPASGPRSSAPAATAAPAGTAPATSASADTAFDDLAPPSITADQDKAIRAQFQALGWTSRQVVDWLKASFGAERLAQLSERHARQALRQLGSMQRPQGGAA